MVGGGGSVPWVKMAWLAAASFVVFVALLVATKAAGIPATWALADTARFTGSRFIGIATRAGLFVWASALTACLLPLYTSHVSDPERTFLRASAGVTLMLLIDDSLLVHEAVGGLAGSDDGRATSILEGTVYLLFLVVFLVYARQFWQRLIGSDGRAYLAASLLLFAASTAFDFQEILYELDEAGSARTLVVTAEEGLKFAGIVFWAAFYWSVAREAIGGTSPAESAAVLTDDSWRAAETEPSRHRSRSGPETTTAPAG